jgi:hypothetical protein
LFGLAPKEQSVATASAQIRSAQNNGHPARIIVIVSNVDAQKNLAALSAKRGAQ